MITGRWISRDEVIRFVDLSIEASYDAVTTLTRHYQSSTISVRDWELLMRRELKKEHIRQYELGRGGRDQMSYADWGRVGVMLKQQYGYLHSFAKDLESGKSVGSAALARVALYPKAAREAYERGHKVALMKSAKPPTEQRWSLGLAEHCEDCIALNSLGWQAINDDPFMGAFPGSGDTACLSNCKCTIMYR
jgi:hypothetical protein